MNTAKSPKDRLKRHSLIVLIVAVCFFGLAAWAERQQEHSYLWSVDGDRFRLAAFMAPAHHHSRELPWDGIERISGEADLDEPETTILVLHYGPVAFRMPSQSDRNIHRFTSYIGRLDAFLAAARSGDGTATVLYLDPFFLVTITAAVLSLVAWIGLFVMIVRAPEPKNPD